MLVAVLGVHLEDGFGKMEPALFYLVSYIFLIIGGAGKISIDGMTEKKTNDW
jgi:uncharacterized membrane protein YphA (DoxX/SURF4 family)